MSTPKEIAKSLSDIDVNNGISNACPLAGNQISESTGPEKIMYIMRGPSGSGKSTMAKTLVGDGKIFSTDNYPGLYDNGTFVSRLLHRAHKWNQDEARKAANQGVNPIIIDNTNLSMSEIKPYLLIGMSAGYKVVIKTPKTTWMFDPTELLNHSQHLPKDGKGLHIAKRMVKKYEPMAEGAVTTEDIERILNAKNL